ncbi:Uncharacterized protein OS=Planctomyces limnophilus (strain ATCC 43296 / DSM 3776 / IFAM 1008 / 290) GN=Plim_3741 PE=4 SV=1: DUF4350 [Gemmataceae bacterium]|nr:Uncharacterized protein OS=Planctomyces limnophilus (strain ATCC 43296 / DSM 3776 / IFAM 1008 / 290) GN=Plim_3741 PE=4 SV=1: DUF4350 [Gemmataceae bacterium]VTU00962.1 Uncharacterized protein OS=Planctomyces limnophilus (strain ATCC 43296 / DSM 3776 / IFAM 1008 / 290) GN=Plim_3741 PE=4 SV=1: DUF4350 [Gemmataceae bacterium]
MLDSSAPPSDDATAPGSRLWWAVPAVATVLLGLFGLLFGRGPETVDQGTSYDASDRGFRAAYLLLDELDYPVERSRRPAGGDLRWVLHPTRLDDKAAAELDAWVKRGGVLLLAVTDSDAARRLGLAVAVSGEWGPAAGTAATLPGGEAFTVLPGGTTVTGPPGGRTWGGTDGGPLATVYSRERGEIWLLHRPDLLTNANLRAGTDNGLLACRLASAMLRERPGGRLAFDEFTHGLRDRPDVVELLFSPPMTAVTIELGLVAALALWHFGSRFGPVRPAPLPPRRSKEEFLDGMAELLARKGDRADAFRTVRDDLLRRLEADLGLSAGTPPALVADEAARRRGADAAALLRLLTAEAPPQGRGAAALLDAIHQLETTADECFQSRPRPR